MPEKSLQVRLEAIAQSPGHFTLTFGSSQYSVIINPAANVTFSEWLRRLSPVLMGQSDPSGQFVPQELLHNVGTWLWQSLLPESAPKEATEVLARALRTEFTPLLLTIPDTLAGLPWELLCDPQQPGDRGFIARRRPLIRFTATETTVISIESPLRVLLLISSPPGLGEDSRVDVESERAVVEQATRNAREAGLLYLFVEDIVTPRRVQQALVRFKPHIVHYIGHGGYDEARGGVLLWEDEQGNELPFPAERLADLLRPRKLHAIVLHACQTGRSNARAEVLGIADTLLHDGIPTVLAQQANFTYESSQRASEAWYTALTAGQSFVEALFEVRQALSQADRPDWAVPILQGSGASLAPVLDTTSLPGLADPLLTSSEVSADLPTPTGVFVGRHTELRALRLMLESVPGSGPALALITGPGGVGKSTLAAQAVTRYGRTYKAVLTLRCQEYQGVDLFMQWIGEFLKRRGAPSFLEQCLPDPKLSMEAKIEEAIVALNAAGPVLLVIDSLESVQNDNQTISDKALLHLLQKLLTNLRGGRVLITGRYAVKDLLPQGRFAANFRHLELDDLSPYETNQLLASHTTLAHLGETVRQTLIREFGGLPYVYDLLSSNAASQSLDLLIHDVQGRITLERKQRSTEEWQDVRRQVVEFAALEATISLLTEPSRTLLAQLAVLSRPFPLAAIEQGLGAARTTWQPLLDWSLLRYDPKEQKYRLHSLTRRHAEGLLNIQDRTQTQIQLAAWYEQYAEHESHNLADMLEAHRLLRMAGNVRQAGALVMQIEEPLRRYGLYALLRELCNLTLDDIRETDELLAANALFTLGTIAFLQGNYQEARQLYQQSLTIYEHVGDQNRRASSLHQLGSIAHMQGDYQEAQRLYRHGLAIAERQGDLSKRSSIRHNLGSIAYLQGNYQEARQLFKQELEVFERMGDRSRSAACLHQLGMIAQDQGDYQEAQRLYQQSLAIWERLGYQRERASTLGQLGNIAYLQGRSQEAQQLHQQSLAIREQLGDQSGIARSLHGLGTIAQKQGNFEEARQFYRESLTIAERLGDQSECLGILHQLGMIAQMEEDYQEAQRLYRESLTIAERQGDQSGYANTLYQLGTIAQGQGNFEEARQFYSQILVITERLGDQRGRSDILYQLGTIAQGQGNFEEARQFYQESLAIREQQGDQSGCALPLHQLGMIAQRQGDYEEARLLYLQCLAIAEQLGNQGGRASFLGQLGNLAYEQGNYEEALRYTAQAYILFDSLKSPARDIAAGEIARIRIQLGDDAFTVCWQAITGSRPVLIFADDDMSQQLLQVVIDFIQAPTWSASKHFLETHLELLQPEVDAVLKALAKQQKQDISRKIIEERRLQLARCRDDGIEAAYAKFQEEQSPENSFVSELNSICNEVIATLRAGNREEQEELATRLELRLKADFHTEGAKEFLQLLISWLRGQDTQTLQEKLQPPFRDAYDRLTAAKEATHTDENSAPALED